jgi:MFS family permease
LETRQSFWLIKVFDEASRDWRTCNKLFSHLSRRAIRTGELELLYDISFQLERTHGRYFTCSRRRARRSSAGRVNKSCCPKTWKRKKHLPRFVIVYIGLVLFAFATQGWMMFAFLVPYCLGGICGPSLQSVISIHVPSNQQGELQGALTSLMSLTTIIGPPVMNGAFSYFTTDKAPFYLPGIHFLLGAICMLASIFLTWRILRREKQAAVESPAPTTGGHREVSG